MYSMMLVLVFLAVEDDASKDSWHQAALTLLGAPQWEELDEEMVDHLEGYLSRPLPLNTASLATMQESGLLSFYQCAVIEDWRQHNGDILSFEELAVLDGFSHELAQALRPFVSLASSGLAGRSSLPSGRSRHQLACRTAGALKRTEAVAIHGSAGASEGQAAGSDGAALGKGALDLGVGLKYAMDWSGRLRCGIGGSVTLPFVPRAGTAASGGGRASDSSSGGGLALSKFSWNARALHPYISWQGQKWLGQLLAGDYHLRFSQGLCLWSGFSLSGFSAPDSFARRPTGISPYGSFSQTPALRGVAAQFRWSAFQVSVATNVGNWLQTGRFSPAEDFLAAEVNWHTRKGYLSLTGVSTGKVSLGGHFCLHGTDVFGEACFDGSAHSAVWAAVAGTCIPLADALKASLSLRYYAPDFSSRYCGAVRAGSQCANEAGAALGLQLKGWRKAKLTASLDACLHPRTRDASRKHTAQIKSQMDGIYTPHKEWSLHGRATARFRNYDRRSKYDAKLSAAWQPAFLRWHTAPNKSTSSLLLSSASSFPNADSHPEAANPVSSSSGFPVTPSARGSVSPSSESPYLCYVQASGGVVLCHCAAWGVLLHLEESLHTPWGSVYLQEGWHRAPQWDDRLYLYERSAPGSFSVPARYGQGWFLHLYLSGLIPIAFRQRSLLPPSMGPTSLSSSSGSSTLPASSAAGSGSGSGSSSSFSSSASPSFRFAPRFKYYLGLDYRDFTYKSIRHQTLTLLLQLNIDF